MSYAVLRLPVASFEEAQDLGGFDNYRDVLKFVAKWAKGPLSVVLRPVNAHSVVALHRYDAVQAWEVSIDGERTAFIFVQDRS